MFLDSFLRIASQLELAEVHRASAKALRYRSEQHATLLNQAPMGIYLVDADFRIREANPIAKRAFGGLPGGVEGRDFVDDNIDAADSLAMILEMQGHTTAAVYTSADALQKAAAFEPDAVLLDIGLPEMNGYEVAHAIRLMPKLKNVRLIALTGYGRREDQQRTLTAGFDAHLTKPVEPSTLTQALTPPRH